MGMHVAKALVGVDGTAVSYSLMQPEAKTTVLEAQAISGLVDGIGNMTTRYYHSSPTASRDANGTSQVVGVESWNYIPRRLTTVSYRCQDLLTGEQSVVAVEGDRATVSYQAAADADLSTREIPWTNTTFAGCALPVYIVKMWADLRQGKPVDFDLYVPFRMEALGFRLTPQFGVAPRSIKVVAEARNWLIRQFAPRIAFTFFDGVEPVMTAYEGPSQLAIDGQKFKPVVINFSNQ